MTLSEESKRQLVLLIAERSGDLLIQRFVASMTVDLAANRRGLFPEAELGRALEDAADPFFRQILQRRLTPSRSRQRDISRKRVGQDGRINLKLGHVAVRWRPGEKFALRAIDEDVQNGVFEGRVRGM